MLPWKLRKCQILPVNQNLSLIHFLLAKFQLVSCNPSLAISWQMTYTQRLPKLCSATLTVNNISEVVKTLIIHIGSCLKPRCVVPEYAYPPPPPPNGGQRKFRGKGVDGLSSLFPELRVRLISKLSVISQLIGVSKKKIVFIHDLLFAVG